MGHLEHEKDLKNCGCPSCDLMEAYMKKFEDYKTRKAYRVFFSGNHDAAAIELELNKHQEQGYEMTAIITDRVIMRSMPPAAPTNTDVINEFTSRQEKLKERNQSQNDEIKDLVEGEKDDFGPTVGSA
jgi:hypothetical protein